jgi:molecular chaperone DnaK (HSP70)
MEEKYVFGIDLGTTYSCISYFDENGQSIPCQNVEGSTTTPSVVRLEPGSNPVVGLAAKNTAVLYPDYTIQFVKSRIGKDSSFKYGPDFSEETTPIAVSAEILKKLASDAAAYTNSEVKRVVITVPAYFGDSEKKATLQAGLDAGLDVLSVVEEPTAAAIYYGLNKSDKPETVIVFDLGGGTFDVTAMKIDGKKFSVITTEGDHDLGGKNWDAALINLVKEKFQDMTGYDGEYDSDIEQELVIGCEQAKIILTQADKATVPVKIDREYKGVVEVTREEFDLVTTNLLNSAISLTKKVIERLPEPATKILLVGGSTFMPQVKEAIEREFPQLAIFSNEPNESVSKGAAIYAYNRYIAEQASVETTIIDGTPETSDTGSSNGGTKTIGGEIKTYENIKSLAGESIIITTIANKSLGVRILLDGKPTINNLILKDTELPTSCTEVYGTNEPNATRIPINIYQANNYDEYYEVDDNLMIGTAMLELSGDLPQHSPIEVTLAIEVDGLIHVKAVDKTNGVEVKAEIENDAYTKKQ